MNHQDYTTDPKYHNQRLCRPMNINSADNICPFLILRKKIKVLKLKSSFFIRNLPEQTPDISILFPLISVKYSVQEQGYFGLLQNKFTTATGIE